MLGVQGAPAAATLTIYSGAVQVERQGTTAFVAVHSGEPLHGGDTVQTSDSTRAAITFSDGSVTRLDANTRLDVKALVRQGNSISVDLSQETGKTWNKVARLVGQSTFKVHGPNNSTAEVRGTEFSMVVEKDPVTGHPIVHIDAYQGQVDVTANGSAAVHLDSGKATTIVFQQKPAAPVDIPPGDRQSQWTIVNIAAGANPAPASAQLNIAADVINQGETTSAKPGAGGDGNTDLSFTLSWPGSTFELIVIDPDGNVFDSVQSDQHPFTIVVPKARSGDWTYKVHDVRSAPAEVWSVVVGKITPSNLPARTFFAGVDGKPCDSSVAAGHTVSLLLSARSSAGRPALSAGTLPAYASFTDKADGTGALVISPPLNLAASQTLDVAITATAGGVSAVFNCTIHVTALPAASTIGGSVTLHGVALPAVQLSLTRPDGGTVSQSTGSDGHYSFGQLGAGTYTVTVTPPAGLTVSVASSLVRTVDGIASAVADFALLQQATSTALTSSANPSVFGQSITLTANVSPASAGGVVTFLDGTTTMATGTLAGGQASVAISTLAAGAHSLTASYGGDSSSAASTSTALSQQIGPATTTTALSTAPNPSNLGQSVTMTATVTPGGATGTVSFLDGATRLGTASVATGQAVFTTSALGANHHQLTAVYGGDPSYSASTSAAVDQSVVGGPTATSLSAIPTAPVSGQPVTLTAPVVPAVGGPATGTVSFTDGATTLGTAPLVSGVAALTISFGAGTHSLVAAYSGDGGFEVSSSPAVTLVVGQASSAASLSVTPSPSVYGQGVTFTATITAVTPGTGTPTGLVDFRDGGISLGSAALGGGQATLTTAALATASHVVTAVYGGDANFLGSTSSPVTQTVNRASSTTSAASSSNPSTYGQSVTFTATVIATATGTVTFKDGTTTLGTGTLSSGTASFATSALGVGTHSITAVYSGDGNFSGSTSSAVTQTVNRSASATSLASNANPSTYGQPVSFTATVSPASATGTVTFKDGIITLGTAALTSGTASFATGVLVAGSHSITGVYGGDVNFSGSTSIAVAQTVNQAASSATMTSSANPSTYGQSLTFTAMVTSVAGTPTGTVTFKDGTTALGTGSLAAGIATLTTGPLGGGTHSITAVYGGDINFLGSTSAAFTQTVNQATTSTSVSSSGSTSSYGQSVTFTASVSSTAGIPTGPVTFMDGTTTLGTGSLSSGMASFTGGAFGVGFHSITAVYGGDANFSGSTSSPVIQTVTQAASSTSVASAANPSTYGQSVTFTATVTSTPATASGTVTFKDGSVTLGSATVASGTATFATSALGAGSHSITAVYGGDTIFSGSTSSTLTQTVNQATSATSVTAAPDPSSFGQSVTFTATITSTPATATGRVNFMDGATLLGTGTVSSRTASFATSVLVAGSHSITGVYGGDVNFSGSTSIAVAQTVNQTGTATSWTSAPNPSTYGQSVTFTATVTSVGGTPSGTVSFKDAGTLFGTGTLAGGVATFATGSLGGGSHSITAVYGGDTNFLTSTSSALAQTVNPATTVTALTAAPSPSTYGQTVTFTATVSSTAGVPTGTVTFQDATTPIATTSMITGTASFGTALLGAGSHPITAVYGGDANFSGSTSIAVPQTVNQAGSATSWTSAPNPSTYGQSVIFTATVTSTPATASGTVTFKDGLTPIGTGTVASGTATFATSTLGAGSHSITAVYGGDTNFSSSTSSPLTQTVNQATSAISMTAAPNPSSFGQSVTFTATVSSSPGTATGTVTFNDGVIPLGTGTVASGTATFATSALATGGHNVTAVYGGDVNFSGSTSIAVTQTVNQAGSATSLTSAPNPSPYSQSVTFTATVTSMGGTPSGTVSFKDAGSLFGTGTLAGGVATFATGALGGGAHSITAFYGGDTNFLNSTSSALTQTVNLATTITAMTAAPDPSSYGQTVTFTATVSSTAGVPTGTVSFLDGATGLGTGTLSAGIATFAIDSLSAGAHPITAVYGGDANFATSTSTPTTQSVSAATTYTNAVIANQPAVYYRLGESSGTVATDSSPNGRSGTYTGAVVFAQAGAIVGDTNTAVSLPSSAASISYPAGTGLPTGSAPRTLEAWINSNIQFAHVIGYGNAATSQYFGFDVNGSEMQVQAGPSSYAFHMPYVISNGNYHHLVLTYDGNMLVAYLDGQTFSPQPAGVLNTNLTAAGLLIGGTQLPADDFSGVVDEVAVYPTALSQLQVLNHFNLSGNSRPAAPTVTSIVGGANSVTVGYSSGAATGFVVTAFNGTTQTNAIATTSPSTATITGLPAGTYTVNVAGYNNFGQGPAAASGPVTVTGAATTYSGTVRGDGPSIYYRLGETTGKVAADSSGNNRGGFYNTFFGTYTQGVPGALPSDSDPAVKLTGGDIYYPLDLGGIPTGNAPRSFEAWVNSSSTALQDIMGGYFSFTVYLNNGNQIQLGDRTTIFGALTAPYVIANGNWHHVVVTYDGTTGTVYLDGQSLGTFSPGTLTTTTDLTFDIGARESAPADQFAGSLDEVAVYPVALTSGQVAAHFAASGNLSPGAPTGLVGSSASNNQASLTWAPGTAGTNPLQGYIVSAYQVGTRERASVAVSATSTAATLVGLPSGSYKLTVAGYSNFGLGPAASTCCVAVNGLLTTYVGVITGDSPTLYYRFSESSGTLAADSSGNNVIGGYFAAPLLGTSSAGATTDGDTALTLVSTGQRMQATGGSGLPKGNAARTLEFWLKTTATTGAIAGWGDESKVGGSFRLYLTSGRTFQLRLGGATNNMTFTSGIPLNDGLWHYFAVTFDGLNQICIAEDGGALPCQPPIVTPNTILDPFGLIIGEDEAAGNQLSGSVDEVAIYAGALTSTRETAHFLNK